MTLKVAIFGAGMAGLSAAHELAKTEDIVIDVYERDDGIGGKSRNQHGMVLSSGANGRRDLLGEHGFRFFPSFYRNIIDTLKAIPASVGNVGERLQNSPEAGLVRNASGLMPFARHVDISGLSDALPKLYDLYQELGFTPEDIGRMAWFRVKYLTSCRERRLGYDEKTWWHFIDGDSPRYTEAFKEFEASIPRTMSALVAKETSALVVGDVSMQFLIGVAENQPDEDRLLDGPTEEAWLDDWYTDLTRDVQGQKRVNFHFNHELTKFELAVDGSKIKSVTVKSNGTETKIDANYYIVAVPVERFVPLIDNAMRAADKQLDTLVSQYDEDKWTGWMVGAQIALGKDEPMVAGHVFYPSSAWALTSVSQAQFWANRGNLESRFGDGNTRGVLSVIISDWDTGSDEFPKAFDTTSRADLIDVLKKQLRHELTNANIDLSDGNITGIHLDEAVNRNGGQWTNETKLLLHPPGAYAARPNVQGSIKNLLLAGDYIKTDVKLATMESANESARLAVNVIFDDDLLPAVPVWPLSEPPTLEPFKKLDQAYFDLGLDHPMDEPPLSLLLNAPDFVPFVGPILEFIDQLRP